MSENRDLERELKSFVRQMRPGLIGATSNPNVNLSQILDELRASKTSREQLSQALLDFLVTQDFCTAITETGLTLEAGVFSEVYKRLEYKLLPKPVESLDILSFLRRLFDGHSDAEWLEGVDRELWVQFFELILPDHDRLLDALGPQLFMSLEILGLRLAGLGYDPLVTHRLKVRRDLQGAFMDVPRHIHNLLDGDAETSVPGLMQSLGRCAEAVQWIRSRRGVEGASMALTYRLMKIQQVVHRMEMLMELIRAVMSEWRTRPAVDLYVEILLAELRRFELRRFFAGNVELLAFQITEHTGKMGEHYITRTRSEWLEMARSAALGGVIVAGLAVLKVLLTKLHLPPGTEALALGVLYASGFVAIGWLGGTLATKQPAMTASTLASALDEAKSSKQAMMNLSEVIVRTIRSQLVALFGNFFIAFPVAAALCWPLMYWKVPLMAPDKAMATMASLHPFKTLSLWYAALAGVCLFVSGLLAGLADNWFVFNQVGPRLRHSQMLLNFTGRHNLERVIQSIDRNLGFWVGNISLGFFLAGMAALGSITGLPLDIRHITFSSATLGASVASVGFNLEASYVALLAGGVFVMGLINLGVSFSLSLYVVIRSRRIRFSQTPELWNLLIQRLRTRPRDFFFPPRDSA